MGGIKNFNIPQIVAQTEKRRGVDKTPLYMDAKRLPQEHNCESRDVEGKSLKSGQLKN